MAFQFNVEEYRHGTVTNHGTASRAWSIGKTSMIVILTFAFGLIVGDLMRPNSYLGQVLLPEANRLVASLAAQRGHGW